MLRSIIQFMLKSSSSSPNGLINCSATCAKHLLHHRDCANSLLDDQTNLEPTHVEEELEESEHWNVEVDLVPGFAIARLDVLTTEERTSKERVNGKSGYLQE